MNYCEVVRSSDGRGSNAPFFHPSNQPSRSKMPEKTDEERERIAKKLADQRAKLEGMPTTAKVCIQTGASVELGHDVIHKSSYYY